MTQERIKYHANKKCSEREFTIGIWVYLRLQPYGKAHWLLEGFSNFLLDSLCPFQVVERIGKVAYKLDLPQHLPFILYFIFLF